MRARDNTKYEDFILGVQSRASLDSIEDARVVCHATLVALGEYLAEGEKEYLASRLPASMEECLTGKTDSDHASCRSLEDFYRRVGVRAGLHLREARRRSRTVIVVLDEILGDDETQEARVLLTDKLEPLLHD